MKKICILILALLLMAVPALGAGDLVNDGEGLLTIEQAAELEAYYADFAASYGFTPVLVTVDHAGTTA